MAAEPEDPLKNPRLNKFYFDCKNLKNKISYAKSLHEIFYILKGCNIQYKQIAFSKADPILAINYRNKLHIIDGEGNFELRTGEEWIQNIIESGYIDFYVEPSDFNKQFWEGVSDYKLYHGTSRENIEDIMTQGLRPSYKTRGLSNQGTGSAIFTSSEESTASYYYDVVIEINVGAMKADGYMPYVSIEEPLSEAEAINSLANKIGLENYEHQIDSSDGLSFDTVIFYEPIPPKYLRIVKQ